MTYALGCIGTWLLSDAIYSYVLYATARSYNGKRQTWKRDHWLRAIRGAMGVFLIVAGAVV